MSDTPYWYSTSKAPTDPYASAEESAAVMRAATENEKWLYAQLDRIDPHRHEMGSAGDTPALVKLVFELREQLSTPHGRVRDLECVIADLKAECKELLATPQHHKPVSWPCEVIQADFGDNIITLQMPNGNFWVSTGVYQLSPPPQPANKG